MRGETYPSVAALTREVLTPLLEKLQRMDGGEGFKLTKGDRSGRDEQQAIADGHAKLVVRWEFVQKYSREDRRVYFAGLKVITDGYLYPTPATLRATTYPVDKNGKANEAKALARLIEMSRGVAAIRAERAAKEASNEDVLKRARAVMGKRDRDQLGLYLEASGGRARIKISESVYCQPENAGRVAAAWAEFLSAVGKL